MGHGLMVDKVEDYRQIDLAWLKRRGRLTTGYRGEITWSRGGEVISSLGYRSISAWAEEPGS